MNTEGFKISGGKGFKITFENGITVSVQFGWGNYCDHYDYRGDDYATANIRLGAKGSMTAETAIIDAAGFVEYKGDDVQARQTPKEVLETLNYAAKLVSRPANLKKKANHDRDREEWVAHPHQKRRGEVDERSR